MIKKCLICEKEHFKRGQCCSKECSSNLRKKSCFKKYGVENPAQSKKAQDKIKQTNLERYGVKNPFQSEKIKEKIKQMCFEKYGVESHNSSKEIKEKKKQSCLERYGVENAMQSRELKEKVKQTWFKRYGGFTFQSDELKEKIKKTNLNKYGVESHNSSKEIKEKKKQSCLERYGVENFNQKHIPKEFLTQDWWNERKDFLEAKELSNCYISLSNIYLYAHRFRPDWEFKTISQPHQRVLNFLGELNIEHEINDREQIKPYELDVWIPEKSLAIEVNGVYWHKNKDKYHQMKTELCIKQGIRLLHFTDIEIEQQWDLVKETIKKYL